MIKPNYYKGKDGKDLFDRFEDGLLTKEEVVGFYKGNIIKYVTRFEQKNGVEDLDKAITYLNRLKDFESHHMYDLHFSIDGDDEGQIRAFNAEIQRMKQQIKNSVKREKEV